MSVIGLLQQWCSCEKGPVLQVTRRASNTAGENSGCMLGITPRRLWVQSKTTSVSGILLCGWSLHSLQTAWVAHPRWLSPSFNFLGDWNNFQDSITCTIFLTRCKCDQTDSHRYTDQWIKNKRTNSVKNYTRRRWVYLSLRNAFLLYSPEFLFEASLGFTISTGFSTKYSSSSVRNASRLGLIVSDV